MKKISLLALMLFSALGMSAQKSKTDTLVVTTTPQMHCSGCENKIKQNIRFVKGTKKILTSVSNQEVTIVYDPRKATKENFIEAFKKIGYEVKFLEKKH